MKKREKEKQIINVNRLINGILLSFACVVSISVLIYNECVIEKEPINTQTFLQTMDMGTEKFQIGLLNPLEEGRMNDDVIIRSWHADAEEGYLYLFLPDSWRAESVYWVFNLEDSVLIDGSEIKNGSRMNVAEGSHTLELHSGEQYTMDVLYASNIATLFLELDEEDLEEIQEDKENIAMGRYTLFGSDGTCDYSGKIETISCRGNSSFYEAGGKKSYTIELEEAVDVWGFGISDKWLLLSNYADKSLLRNTFINEVANESGMLYTPQMDYVDVYMNGEYAGNYLLSEKLEIDPGRLDVYDLEEENKYYNANQKYKYNNKITENVDGFVELKWNEMDMEPQNLRGSYLLEIDMNSRYKEESSGFVTSRNRAVVIQSPKWASYNQVKYIAEMYQDFEDAIHSADGINPNSQLHYEEYIDIDSFVNHYLIDEISKQLDAATTSFYLYKPKDSDKIYAGPIWDYDKSLGSEHLLDSSPGGLYAAQDKTYADVWYALYSQKDFRKQVNSVYEGQMRTTALHVCQQWLPEMTDRIYKSAVMDALRWNTYGSIADVERITDLYYDEISLIQEFTQKRLEFLDKEWK